MCERKEARAKGTVEGRRRRPARVEGEMPGNAAGGRGGPEGEVEGVSRSRLVRDSFVRRRRRRCEGTGRARLIQSVHKIEIKLNLEKFEFYTIAYINTKFKELFFLVLNKV